MWNVSFAPLQPLSAGWIRDLRFTVYDLRYLRFNGITLQSSTILLDNPFQILRHFRQWLQAHPHRTFHVFPDDGVYPGKVFLPGRIIFAKLRAATFFALQRSAGDRFG